MNHRLLPSTLAAALAVATLSACSKSGTNAGPPAPAAPPAAATPATYTINISPAWTVGQIFDYVGDDVTNSPDGKETVHFEATGEIVSLTPNGNPQKVIYTVKGLRVNGGEVPARQFPGQGRKDCRRIRRR